MPGRCVASRNIRTVAEELTEVLCEVAISGFFLGPSSCHNELIEAADAFQSWEMGFNLDGDVVRPSSTDMEAEIVAGFVRAGGHTARVVRWHDSRHDSGYMSDLL